MTQNNETQIILLNSAARTATPTDSSLLVENESAFIVAQFGRFQKYSAHIIIDVTAQSGGSFIPSIQNYDKASNKYYDVLVGKAISTTGMTNLRIGPDYAPKANLVAKDFLTQKWKLLLTHQNSNSITYSCGANVFHA